MRISEVIELLKAQCGSTWDGRTITDATTRDQVLWGDPTLPCTGVVVCIYASPQVIRRAGELGANLIVCHEALFWNHGDATDWLADNTAFQKKRALLGEAGVCVWRNHDHIHAGVPVAGALRDGIFYGIGRALGWRRARPRQQLGCEGVSSTACGHDLDASPESDQAAAWNDCVFEVPDLEAVEVCRTVMDTFELDGLRVIGSERARVRRALVPLHIQGRPERDCELISLIQHENINCLIALELVDFTVAEYVRDAAEMGEDRCILSVGHFNVERLGMKWYAAYLRGSQVFDVPVHYVSTGDTYRHVLREHRSR